MEEIDFEIDHFSNFWTSLTLNQVNIHTDKRMDICNKIIDRWMLFIVKEIFCPYTGVSINVETFI